MKVAIQFTGELENKKEIAGVFGSDALFCSKDKIESILLKDVVEEAFIGDYVCINEHGKYEVIKK